MSQEATAQRFLLAYAHLLATFTRRDGEQDLDVAQRGITQMVTFIHSLTHHQVATLAHYISICRISTHEGSVHIYQRLLSDVVDTGGTLPPVAFRVQMEHGVAYCINNFNTDDELPFAQHAIMNSMQNITCIRLRKASFCFTRNVMLVVLAVMRLHRLHTSGKLPANPVSPPPQSSAEEEPLTPAVHGPIDELIRFLVRVNRRVTERIVDHDFGLQSFCYHPSYGNSRPAGPESALFLRFHLPFPCRWQGMYGTDDAEYGYLDLLHVD